MIGISWRRFSVLALLLIVSGILQNIPPFFWTYTTVQRVEPDPLPASQIQKNRITLLRASMPTLREAADGGVNVGRLRDLAIAGIARDFRGRQIVSVRGHPEKREVSRSDNHLFKGL